jgi:large subunit ribosomal protein L11
LKSGANLPGRETVGSVTTAQVKEIAEAKMKDLNANDIDAAMQIILGSARSMGIEVK